MRMEWVQLASAKSTSVQTQGAVSTSTGKGEGAPDPRTTARRTRGRKTPAEGDGRRVRSSQPWSGYAFRDTQKATYAIPARPTGQVDFPEHPVPTGGDYVDEATGKALRDAEREEYQQFRERFHKRCKLGGKADRLVRIVDNYMPRLSKENRVFVMKFPNKVEKMLRKARRIRRRIRAKRQKQQGGTTTQPKDAPLEGTRPTSLGENAGQNAEQHNEASLLEDTPPDWGSSHEDPDTAGTQGTNGHSSEGEENEPRASHWPWGPDGKTVGYRPEPRNIGRKTRRADGQPSAHAGWTSCTTGTPCRTKAEPTVATSTASPSLHGPVCQTTWGKAGGTDTAQFARRRGGRPEEPQRVTAERTQHGRDLILSERRKIFRSFRLWSKGGIPFSLPWVSANVVCSARCKAESLMSRLLEGVKSLNRPGGLPLAFPVANSTRQDLGPTWPTILVSFQRTPRHLLTQESEGKSLIRIWRGRP